MPIKPLLVPPGILALSFLIFMLPFARDIHSGGAVLAIGFVLFIAFVGVIYELFVIPKAIKTLRENHYLRSRKNIIILSISIAYTVIVISYFSYFTITLTTY